MWIAKNVKFRDLGDDDKDEKDSELTSCFLFSIFSPQWTEQVKEAISDFSVSARTSQIDPGLRRLVRENQYIAREAAPRSRELALECLTTQNFNIFCCYHHEIDKKGKKIDGKEGEKVVLNGVPLPRETVHTDAPKALKKRNGLISDAAETPRVSKCVVVSKNLKLRGQDGAQAPLIRTCAVVFRYYAQAGVR